MKLDINMGSIWTMLVGTALAITYMFNTFVTTSEFEAYVVEAYYDSYYELLDRVEEEKEEGNQAFVIELSRRLERLKAKICASDPEWERCKGETR